jgi:hypothetical protein
MCSVCLTFAKVREIESEMASLYVVGARRRKRVLREGTEWDLYDAAVILQLDTDSGAVRTCVEYETPPGARPDQKSSTIFKSGTLVKGILYICTKTEILTFRVPGFQRIDYISLPCFHDVHHVTPASDGTLLVANTGLDMVATVSPTGELLAASNVLGEPPWSRFSPTVDYRKVETTKPHKAHPNFVFELNGDVWVTRFHQRDAICLKDSRKRIEIAVEAPHDGIVRGEQVFFTSVDGRIIIANSRNLKVEQIIDLKQVDGPQALLGWCRGLLPLRDGRVWVGFSRIRKTWYEENVKWVKNVLREGMHEKPTHIALYDLVNQRCIQEFDLEAHGLHVLFSIFPGPPPESVGKTFS